MKLLFLRATVLVALCLPHLCVAKEPVIALELDPTAATAKSMPMWLGYLMARQVYRLKHNLPLPPSGEILPSFDEEVSARLDAVEIYLELKQKDKGLNEPYWETLSQIKAKGFIKPYVWNYLRRSSWPRDQQPKELPQFQNWARANLINHKAQTVGRLAVQK